jgi:hypothetical protein
MKTLTLNRPHRKRTSKKTHTLSQGNVLRNTFIPTASLRKWRVDRHLNVSNVEVTCNA